jgi:hypothetical protein
MLREHSSAASAATRVLSYDEIRERLGGISKSCLQRTVLPCLPTVAVSPRRRGVREVDLEAYVSGLTRPPAGGSVPEWMS